MERVIHVATVIAADGVQFAAADASRTALTRRLAEYVRGRCARQLSPAGAASVRAMLDDGKLDDAVAAYFALVGERWDTEWLVTTVTSVSVETHWARQLDPVLSR